jgi:hypothetical protein
MKAQRLTYFLIAASLASMVGCATKHQVADSKVFQNVQEIKSMAVFFVIDDVIQRAE